MGETPAAVEAAVNPRPSRRAPAFAALAFAALAPCLVQPAAAQDPAAERLYAEARRLREAGDVRAAVDELELFLRQFPTDRLASRALLDVAELHRGQGDPAASRAAAERLTTTYPRTAEAASGFLLLGEERLAAARSLADLEAARTTLRRIALLYGPDAFPQLEARQVARVRSAEASLLLGDLTTSAAELLAAIEEEPVGPFSGRARLLFARGLLLGPSWVPAVETLGRVAGAAIEGPDRTAFPEDKRRARNLLGLLHRRFLRGLAGQPAWAATVRWPKAGLALRKPVGVAADGDGNLLVIDEDGPLTAILDADGNATARKAVPDAINPGFARDGRAYVLVEDGRIALPFAGLNLDVADPRPGKDGPVKAVEAAVPGVFGDWLVIAKGLDGVLAYDASGRPVGSLLADTKTEPVDLAVDDLGRFYVLDARANTVQRFGPDRRPQGVVARGTWEKATAVAVDALGDVYVLDRGEARIDVFDGAGRRLATLGPQLGGGIELKNPVDLAVDAAGRVFIADSKLPFLVAVE